MSSSPVAAAAGSSSKKSKEADKGEATSTSPSQQQLYDDVKKLLFEDCKDTSTWDFMGNTDPVRRPGDRRARVAAQEVTEVVDDQLEFIVLPVGIALLAQALNTIVLSEESHPALTAAIEAISEPPPPIDHCTELYRRGVEATRELAALNRRRQEARIDSECKDCTFKPEVSQHAKDQPGRGPDNFFETCVDWKKQKVKKLQLKAAKEEKEKREEAYQPWQMNKRSLMIVRRIRARDSEKGSGGGGGADTAPSYSTPQHHARRTAFDPSEFVFSFTPLTNSTMRRNQFLIAKSDSGGAAGAARGPSAEASEGGGVSGGDTHSNIINRLQDDILERRRRTDERKRIKERRQHERLFDPNTGQALFVPNAMPTVMKNGKRVAFSTLSREEKEAFHKTLRSRRIEFTPEVVERRDAEATREMDDIVKFLLDKQKAGMGKVERTRRKEERELDTLFNPKLDKYSMHLLKKSDTHKQRPPLHEPRRGHNQQQGGDSASPCRSAERSASAATMPSGAAKTRKQPASNIHESSSGSIVQRTSEWQERRLLNRRRKQQQEQEELERMRREEWGKPQILKRSQNLIASAERRLLNQYMSLPPELRSPSGRSGSSRDEFGAQPQHQYYTLDQENGQHQQSASPYIIPQQQQQQQQQQQVSPVRRVSSRTFARETQRSASDSVRRDESADVQLLDEQIDDILRDMSYLPSSAIGASSAVRAAAAGEGHSVGAITQSPSGSDTGAMRSKSAQAAASALVELETLLDDWEALKVNVSHSAGKTPE